MDTCYNMCASTKACSGEGQCSFDRAAYSNCIFPADPLCSKSGHQFVSSVQFDFHLFGFLPQVILHGQLLGVLLFQLVQHLINLVNII